MTAPGVPRTAAGRLLLVGIKDLAAIYPHAPLSDGEIAAWVEDILAIEAEAAASGLDAHCPCPDHYAAHYADVCPCDEHDHP